MCIGKWHTSEKLIYEQAGNTFDFMADLQTAITEACSTGKERTRLIIIKRQAALKSCESMLKLMQA